MEQAEAGAARALSYQVRAWPLQEIRLLIRGVCTSRFGLTPTLPSGSFRNPQIGRAKLRRARLPALGTCVCTARRSCHCL